GARRRVGGEVQGHVSVLARERAHAFRRRCRSEDARVQGVPREHREDLMALVTEAVTTYSARRERARDLGGRYDFAREPLRLYLALGQPPDRALERAGCARP